MSDCLHCDIHEMMESHLQSEQADLADIAAKVTEVLADLILMAPPDEQLRLLADVLTNLGGMVLEKALAWISTARNEPNISAFSALLDEAERAAIPPRDGDGFVEQSGGEDDGQVSASVEAHRDLALGDGDVGRHVDEVAEDLARLSVTVSAHAAGHEAIEA